MSGVGEKKIIVRDAFPIKDKEETSAAVQRNYRTDGTASKWDTKGKVLEYTKRQQAVNQSEKEKCIQ